MWKDLSKRLSWMIMLGVGLGVLVGLVERSLSFGAAVGGGMLTFAFAGLAGQVLTSNIRFARVKREPFEWQAPVAIMVIALLVFWSTLALIGAAPEANATPSASVIASAVVGLLLGLASWFFSE